jgi:opine dehydrogenase
VTQCLFNLSRIENGEDFDFFGAPLTKRTAAFMEECDKERLAIGKNLGLELAPLLATLNSFWGTRAGTLYEALTENPSYLAVKGPTTLASRYITEDLPCGLTSLLDLSDMMHVDCPHITALVYTMALYLRQPYRPFLTLQDLRVLKGLK